MRYKINYVEKNNNILLFPNADLKLALAADIEIRAKRIIKKEEFIR